MNMLSSLPFTEEQFFHHLGWPSHSCTQVSNGRDTNSSISTKEMAETDSRISGRWEHVLIWQYKQAPNRSNTCTFFSYFENDTSVILHYCWTLMLILRWRQNLQHWELTCVMSVILGVIFAQTGTVAFAFIHPQTSSKRAQSWPTAAPILRSGIPCGQEKLISMAS